MCLDTLLTSGVSLHLARPGVIRAAHTWFRTRFDGVVGFGHRCRVHCFIRGSQSSSGNPGRPPPQGLSHGAAPAGASQCSVVSSGCVSGHVPAGDTDDLVAASAACDELRAAVCVLGVCAFWSWSVQSPRWGRSCLQGGGSLGCRCHTLHCSEPVGSPGSVK